MPNRSYYRCNYNRSICSAYSITMQFRRTSWFLFPAFSICVAFVITDNCHPHRKNTGENSISRKFWFQPCNRISPLFLASKVAKANENGNRNITDNGSKNIISNDDNYDDFDDDLWMEEDVLYSIFGEDLMPEEPDSFLSDEDLIQLAMIDFSDPSFDEEDGGNVEKVSKKKSPVLSLQDLKKISSSDLSYFYLRDEIGLSGDVMWKITNQSSSILGMKANKIREKVDLLRNTMQLSDQDVRDLLGAQPSLLQLSARNNLSPTILFLAGRLKLTVQELRSLVLGCPPLLTYSISTLNQKLNFFNSTLGCTEKECRKILLEEPRLMTCSVKTGLLPRYKFLREELMIPTPQIKSIIQKNPNILKMSVDKNLQPKLIFYFIMTLHMDPREVQRLLVKYPQVLNYSLEDHILPITRYMLSLDFSARELAKIYLKFPSFITYSLSKIKYATGYLRFELGLEGSDVRRILYQAPQVVSLSTENLKSKVEFLEKMVGENDAPALRKLIVGMPTLLYLSIENNLAPKISYLQEKMGKEEFQLAIIRMPALLAYSLEKRIQPRMEQIIQAEVVPGSISIGISMKDDAFESWLQGRAEKAERDLSTKARKQTIKSAKGSFIAEESIPKESSTSESQDDNKRVVRDDGRVVHWVRRG